MNAKVWQMVQSSSTKAENLENDYDEFATTIRGRWAGVMLERNPDLGLKKKKSAHEDDQVFFWMSSVSWSGQSCRYRTL